MKFLFRIYFMISEISAKINRDNINAHAACASFFIIVCFFPMIILLLSLIKYTPVTEEMLIALTAASPQQLQSVLVSVIEEIYSRSSVTILSITAIATLWTAGKAFLAISTCLDQIYEVERPRGYLIGRLISCLYTLIFMILLILLMLLMTFGEMAVKFLDTYVPVIYPLIYAIFSNKYIIVLLLSILVIMLVYTFVPKRKSTLIRQLPGAVFAASGWLLFTYVYSEYTSYSRSFSYMYGSLNTIIFVMLWLYFCMYILFLGAEINIMLETKILNIAYLWKHSDKRNE
jgi:membrane protein